MVACRQSGRTAWLTCAASWGTSWRQTASPQATGEGVASAQLQTWFRIVTVVLRGLRGVGAVMYTEAGLRDSTLAKVSLRSVGEEDTTPISEVMSENIRGSFSPSRPSHWDASLIESGIWGRRPQERQLLHRAKGRARGLEGVMRTVAPGAGQRMCFVFRVSRAKREQKWKYNHACVGLNSLKVSSPIVKYAL